MSVMEMTQEPISEFVAKEKAKKPKKPVRKFAMGVAEKITASVLFSIMAAMFAAGAAIYFAQPTAPTIYVDEETGCEYLINGSGITPRMDRIGFQICRSE